MPVGVRSDAVVRTMSYLRDSLGDVRVSQHQKSLRSDLVASEGAVERWSFT